MVSVRTLGSGDAALKVSAQGFGCMGITAFYGDPMDDGDAVELLGRAYSRGITFFDTAEVYTAKAADGSTIYNEAVVGKAVRTMTRSNVQLATKYWPGFRDGKATPDSVVAACRASCQRLQTDYVDLYYAHRFSDNTAVEDQARAFKAVLDAGLARHVGVSEFSPENIRRFHAVCPITAVQQEWSLFNRDLEEEIVPTCRELGIGIVAYSPLSRSLLSTEVKSADDLKAGDLRASRYPRLSAENIPKNAALAQNLRPQAERHGVSTSQLALAWVASQGDDVVPIPGTTKISHLDDNIDSCKLVLSSAELAEAASTVPHTAVSGDRYPSAGSWFKGQIAKEPEEPSGSSL
mmetsp:Transcript_119724/g.339333  ORF Transcript_119724/g.339333 Transcript_119724/m.339333 type:complete len:349 (+) Transcript_119724:67-1113(+)